MSSELSKRTVTALLGVAVLISLIVFAGWPGIFLIATIVSLGMMDEYVRITFSLGDQSEKRYLMLSLVWFIALLNLISPRSEGELILLSFFLLFIYFLFTAKRHGQETFAIHFRELFYAVFGVLYLTILPLFFVKIRDLPNGMHWILLFLFIVWANDVGAYFVGRKYGKRKLMPQVSPKKTVEGSQGGLASGLLVALLYKLILFHGLNWFAAVIIPLVVGILAQIGDLCESFFKRSFDTKDSGSILPGHGGFLDRFDGVVFALPVMYACIRLFGLS